MFMSDIPNYEDVRKLHGRERWEALTKYYVWLDEQRHLDKLAHKAMITRCCRARKKSS